MQLKMVDDTTFYLGERKEIVKFFKPNITSIVKDGVVDLTEQNILEVSRHYRVWSVGDVSDIENSFYLNIEEDLFGKISKFRIAIIDEEKLEGDSLKDLECYLVETKGYKSLDVEVTFADNSHLEDGVLDKMGDAYFSLSDDYFYTVIGDMKEYFTTYNVLLPFEMVVLVNSTDSVTFGDIDFSSDDKVLPQLKCTSNIFKPLTDNDMSDMKKLTKSFLSSYTGDVLDNMLTFLEEALFLVEKRKMRFLINIHMGHKRY